MPNHRFRLAAIILITGGTAMALPKIPKGVSPKEFYDGFFPTEEWVGALEPITREQRQNPFQTVRIIDRVPDDVKERWTGATVRLTQEQLGEKKRDLRRFLEVAAEGYLGLVPRRNRIAGNTRVMPRPRVPCPTGDKGQLKWFPDEPNVIRCNRGHVVDPFDMFPQTGAFKVTGPLGEEQAYPYHDTPDGEKRIYLDSEYLIPLRMWTLAAVARDMGVLFSVTGNVEYARRAAAIVYDFARAVKHWPKVARGYFSGCEGADRFRPIDDYRRYASIWYDKYHSGIGSMPLTLALAYDFVAAAPVWEWLDREAGGDARAVIDRDLFLYTVQDAIRYDIRFPKPSSALSNYIPYQISGLLAIGRAAGLPELVHYAYWKEQQLARKTLMADGMFPESPSYSRQHVYGMARATKLAEGHTDPTGFVSTIDGKRFEGLDMLRDLPELRRAVEVLETLVYPNDENMMVHDTYGRLLSRGHPAPPKTRPLFYPAFGHAVLARGERERANQIQAHLHYSGNWGHDHLDLLNLILWAYKEELLSDIGYAHTYRQFANNTSSHNLVVVDRRYQERYLSMPGGPVAWHPVEGSVQVVEVSAPGAYTQCSVYRRTLFLIPVGDDDNLVLDVFEVAGGRVHEWMAQGSCMIDGALEVSVPTSHFADSYADDGKPFTPPATNEYTRLRRKQGLHPHWLGPDEKDPWYGVFRDVRRGKMSGPMVARLSYELEGCPDLRLHLVAPTDCDVYTCTVPSLRRCWNEAVAAEDHSLVEKFRMPKLVVRRDGDDLRSRFVALWEPTRAEPVVESIKDLTPDHPTAVVLEIETAQGVGRRTIQVLYSTEPNEMLKVDDIEFQGRYAVATRSERGADVALYDCLTFRQGDCRVSVTPRPPLPAEQVVKLGEDDYAVVLDGHWDDVTEGRPRTFAEPEHAILSQNGVNSRAFPIKAVEIKDGNARLRCARHPGFEYSRNDRVLKEVFTPFNTVQGRALVTLPSRVLIRMPSPRPATWRVRTTDPVRVASYAVGPTAKEVVLGR